MAVFNDTTLDRDLENGRFDDAKYHPKLLENSLRSLRALLQKNQEIADRVYKEAIRRHKAAEELLRDAERLIQSKDYKKAAELIGKARKEAEGMAISTLQRVPKIFRIDLHISRRCV